MSIDAAAIAFTGVVIGALVSYLVARSNQRASDQARLEDRWANETTRVRDLVVESYIAAQEGLTYLHGNRLEDSVLDPWRPTWEPKVIAALALVGQARQNLARAAALAGSGDLASIADRTAHELLLFETSWIDGREYAERYHNTKPPAGRERTGMAQFIDERFTATYAQLRDSRRRLIGLEESIAKEIELGGLGPEGLLMRLRAEAGKTSLLIKRDSRFTRRR